MRQPFRISRCAPHFDLPRITFLFLSGYIFKAVRKVDKTKTWSYFVGAISAPVLNTLFFMSYLCIAFYNTDYVQGMVSGVGATNPFTFVILLVGVQALIEAGVCGILGGIVCKALATAMRGRILVDERKAKA